jgi:D-lyxose ketol-isomerase
MITRAEWREARDRAVEILDRTGIALTLREKGEMEVADFGLGDLKHTGLEIVVYANIDRYCAKELILLPQQTCPEHRHPPLGEGNPGKIETLRCRWGRVYLYIPGERTKNPHVRPPKEREKFYTALHEIELNPGEQYTIPPNTLHWFQSGSDGGVISEFSSKSMDETDVFTDPKIKRKTKIIEPKN